MPEGPAVHLGGQVAVGGGDDPEIDLAHAIAPDAVETRATPPRAAAWAAARWGARRSRRGTTCRRPPLRMRPMRRDSAPVNAPFSCPKSSLSIRPLGNRGAVEHRERTLRARGRAVDRLRDQLFSGAALTFDQDGGAAGRDLAKRREQRAHRSAPPHHRSEALVGVEQDRHLFVEQLEHHLSPASTNAKAVLQIDVDHADRLDERSVGAPQIAESKAGLLCDDLEVNAADGFVGEDQIVTALRAYSEYALGDLQGALYAVGVHHDQAIGSNEGRDRPSLLGDDAGGLSPGRAHRSARSHRVAQCASCSFRCHGSGSCLRELECEALIGSAS